MDIICLSTARWDEAIWTNKQHLMQRLAQKGHTILYVDPIKSIPECKKYRYFPYSRVYEVLQRLWVVSWVGLPLSRSPYVQRLNNAFLHRWIQKTMKKMQMHRPLLWTYDPCLYSDMRSVPHQGLVYDCVDSIFLSRSCVDDTERIKLLDRAERDLLHTADVVFTTSEDLFHVKSMVNKNTFLISQAVDETLFKNVRMKHYPLPSDMKMLKKPVIGFIGSLWDNTIDWDLIDTICTQYPHGTVVMIGPTHYLSNQRLCLLQKSKVVLLGTKPYLELPCYLNSMDISIIPYRTDNPHMYSILPMKFFESMISGIPVVTTNLPFSNRYRHLNCVADSQGEFLEKIAYFLAHDSEEQRQARIASVQQYTWENKVNTMLDIIYKKIASQ